MRPRKYVFPKRDFFTQLSIDENEPCQKELEYQEMIIRGVKYLDSRPILLDINIEEDPELYKKEIIRLAKNMMQALSSFDERNSQDIAFVGFATKLATQAKEIGWDKFIEYISSKDELKKKQKKKKAKKK